MMRNQSNLRVVGVALALAALLAGCSAFEVKRDVTAKADALKKGPQARPYQSITNFSSGLRCMDEQFLSHGIRDVSVLVEDLVDTTKKVNAGTKDMLISSVSRMTVRSRAVRLVTFGADSSNLANFHGQAESKIPYKVTPQFGIRGSVTQLDESLVQKQTEGAVNIGIANIGTSAGYAKTATASVLGLDLNIISGADFSVIPGVTANNSVIIFKEGRGVDGEAEYRKFGISYGQTLTKSEGQSQALRTLVELATIELFGKLTKTPYWKCLGADPGSDAVRTEISDWFQAMSNNNEIVLYLQHRLRVRGYYNGPLDGKPNQAFSRAVSRSRTDLGLSGEDKLELEYFSALVNSDRRADASMAEPEKNAGTDAPVAHGTGESLQVAVIASRKGEKFAPGELIKLTISVNRDAHVYCYMQDETQGIMRFYPNRFSKDSLVRSASSLQLPGEMRFQLVANEQGKKETVACFATDQDVSTQLSSNALGVDLEYLSVSSLSEVRDTFVIASEGKLGEGVLYVETR